MIRTDFDGLVIGAGVVGLACARALAMRGHRVVIAEKEASFGQHTSSRNTGVIHAGVYYEPGTWKARLCKQGRDRLYAYCAERGIPHRRIGKLFVATRDDTLEGLEKLYRRALENGIDDLTMIDSREVSRREPAIRSRGGVDCPHSGLVDAHQYMLSLLADAEAAGAILAVNTRVSTAVHEGDRWSVATGDGGRDRVLVRFVVNAAGLAGLDLARRVFPNRVLPTAEPLKGAFLRYIGNSPITRAIYPDLNPGVMVPRVDATPGLDGVLRFGPSSDAAQSTEDYSFPAGLAATLAPHIRSYLPDVAETDLVPDYVGVRPRIKPLGAGPSDFLFDPAPIPGWIDLFNMESPGLTASLAIADHIAGLIDP